jgi:hypothetical protein
MAKRIAPQHHQGDEPPNGLPRIDTRANQLGNLPDRCLGLDPELPDLFDEIIRLADAAQSWAA